MKVYRGPSSTSFYDLTHEFVSTVTPEQLEDGIRSSALIKFNITKDGHQRRAVCTAVFEDEDILPMTSALLDRLRLSQQVLSEIRAACATRELDDHGKVRAVRNLLDKLK